MSSINTNASAMTALQSLAATNKNLETTQGRISTGLRVAEASDNAAYWSIATTMRSDNKANSSVQDALGLGAGKIDTAYTAMNKAMEAVDAIKQKLISAIGASEADKGKIQTEVNQYLEQLKGIATGANYAGSNLLANAADEAADVTVVSAYNRGADGTVSIDKITITGADTQLTDADGEFAGILDGNVGNALARRVDARRYDAGGRRCGGDRTNSFHIDLPGAATPKIPENALLHERGPPIRPTGPDRSRRDRSCPPSDARPASDRR